MRGVLSMVVLAAVGCGAVPEAVPDGFDVSHEGEGLTVHLGGDVFELAHDASTLAWLERRGDQVLVGHMPLAGGTPELHGLGHEFPSGLTLEGGALFWRDATRVFRLVPGGAPEVVLTRAGGLTAFAPSEHGVWWSPAGGGCEVRLGGDRVAACGAIPPRALRATVPGVDVGGLGGLRQVARDGVSATTNVVAAVEQFWVHGRQAFFTQVATTGTFAVQSLDEGPAMVLARGAALHAAVNSDWLAVSGSEHGPLVVRPRAGTQWSAIPVGDAPLALELVGGTLYVATPGRISAWPLC